jgi:hypothetical protein
VLGYRATIQKISMNPELAAMEIHEIREENRWLHCELAWMVLQEAIDKDGAVLLDRALGDRIRWAVGIMDGPVTVALQSSGGAPEALELWRVCTKHISKVYEFGRKGRGQQNSTYHPMLMNWAITFLARTSASKYNEVAKIMMLPHIRTIYWKRAEFITTKIDKAYCLHMNTIQSISERARQESWTSHQRIGAIAQDSANINSGIEHDYVLNTLKGGDESHSVATPSGMFLALAQKVKDARCDEEIEPAASADNFAGVMVVRQNSILDNLPLAEEHMVFKFSSIDPGVKCSEIVATVNVKKVTSGIITLVMIALRDLLPMVGLVVGMATSNAAGCNRASYCDTLLMHTFWDALP